MRIYVNLNSSLLLQTFFYLTFFIGLSQIALAQKSFENVLSKVEPKRVIASNEIKDRPISNIIDGEINTYWAPQNKKRKYGIGEYFEVEFDQPYYINYIKIFSGVYFEPKPGVFNQKNYFELNNRPSKITIQFDGVDQEQFELKDVNEFRTLRIDKTVSKLKITIDEKVIGSHKKAEKWTYLIPEIEFYGITADEAKLIQAVKNGNETYAIELIDKVISKGVSINNLNLITSIEAKVKVGYYVTDKIRHYVTLTPILKYSISKGYPLIVKKLLEEGADKSSLRYPLKGDSNEEIVKNAELALQLRKQHQENLEMAKNPGINFRLEQATLIDSTWSKLWDFLLKEERSKDETIAWKKRRAVLLDSIAIKNEFDYRMSALENEPLAYDNFKTLRASWDNFMGSFAKYNDKVGNFQLDYTDYKKEFTRAYSAKMIEFLERHLDKIKQESYKLKNARDLIDFSNLYLSRSQHYYAYDYYRDSTSTTLSKIWTVNSGIYKRIDSLEQQMEIKHGLVIDYPNNRMSEVKYLIRGRFDAIYFNYKMKMADSHRIIEQQEYLGELIIGFAEALPSKHIPGPEKRSLTTPVCTKYRAEYNGYGIKVSEYCIEKKGGLIGYYSSRIRSLLLNNYNHVWNVNSQPYRGSYYDSFKKFFELNDYKSKAVQRLRENIFRFSYNKMPVLMDGTIAEEKDHYDYYSYDSFIYYLKSL